MRRVVFALSMLALVASLVGCGALQQASPSGSSTTENEVSEQTVGGYTQSMTEDAAEEMTIELGAFDITAEQRELAKDNEAGYVPLDAGRGNPNWINAKARNAFARLMDFATVEC